MRVCYNPLVFMQLGLHTFEEPVKRTAAGFHGLKATKLSSSRTHPSRINMYESSIIEARANVLLSMLA